MSRKSRRTSSRGTISNGDQDDAMSAMKAERTTTVTGGVESESLEECQTTPRNKRSKKSSTAQLVTNGLEGSPRDESAESKAKGNSLELNANGKGKSVEPQSLDAEQQQSLYKLQWPKTFSPRAAFCRFFDRRPQAVESIAFTSDGLWLAVGRSDGQIDIYDVNADTLQMSLPGGESRSVRSLIFVQKLRKPESSEPLPSLFSYRLISTGLHGIITEWNLLTQTATREVPSFGGAIFGADVSRSLGLLVIATDDGSARLFKLRSGAMADSKKGRVSPSRKQRIEGNDGSDSDSDDEQENEEEEEVLTYWKSMTRHKGRLLSVCIYADRWVFGGAADSTVLRWKISNGISDSKMTVHKMLSKPTPNNSNSTTPHGRVERRGGSPTSTTPQETHIWSIIALPHHGVVITGDSVGHVTVWDVTTSTAIKVFHPHESDVLSLCTNALSFFSVGVDGRLNVFNATSTGEWIHNGSRHPHESDIRAVAISSLGRVATGAADTNIKLISHIESLNPHIVQLPAISAVQSSNWILVCEPFRIVVTVHPNRLDVWCLMGENESTSAIGPNKETPTSSPLEGDVKPVKIATIELEDNGPWAGIRSAALSSDGSLIAVSNNCGTRLFKLDLSELTIQTIVFKKLRQHVCSSLEFASIGDEGQECLVAGVISKTKGSNKDRLRLTVWDLENETLVAEFKDVDSAIQSIRVSTDGQWVAIRTSAGRVSLYSLDTMQIVVRLPLFPKFSFHSDAPSSLSMAGAMTFSPDSKYLCVVRSTPGAFMLYDTTTRSLVTANQFKPRYNAYKESGIFKMVNTSTNMGEIGSVQWYTSTPSTKQQLDIQLPLESPLTDFVVDSTKPIQTLLYKTATGIGATRFQLVERSDGPGNEDSDGDEELESTPLQNGTSGRKKRSHEEMTRGSDDGPTAGLKIPPKLNPCKARTQTWNCDILHVMTTGDTQQQPSLLIFSQSRRPDQLPQMFQRKRFAAR